jgi:hypothetical protein
MPGFPNRPDLASFGPDAVNTRAIRDPSRELSALTWNLAKFQLAGLGIVLPRAMLRFTAVASPQILARAEAWNPRGLTSAPFTDPTLTRVGQGNYDVTYASPVTDETGADVALSFSHGHGGILTPSSTTFRLVQVMPKTGAANAVKVCIFDAAGTLQDVTAGVVIYIG